jgi:predicted transcriptional regulator
MTATDITSSLRQVFNTLNELQRAESGEMELPQTQESPPAQALTPKDSIQNDKVICLECGTEMRQISRTHLASHGMSTKEYKRKRSAKAIFSEDFYRGKIGWSKL